MTLFSVPDSLTNTRHKLELHALPWNSSLFMGCRYWKSRYFIHQGP